MVTICTAHWSLYAPHSDHYIYRTLVNICTAQWSLYVPHSAHYMYRKVVSICTTPWSLYVPHSGHYMYHTMVTICTTSLTFTTPRSAHSLYLSFLCGSQNKQPLFPYTTWTDWFFCNRDGVCLLRGTDRLFITQGTFISVEHANEQFHLPSVNNSDAACTIHNCLNTQRAGVLS